MLRVMQSQTMQDLRRDERALTDIGLADGIADDTVQHVCIVDVELTAFEQDGKGGLSRL